MTVKLIIANGANDTVAPTQLLEHWRSHHARLVSEHVGPQRSALTELVKPKRGYHGIATLHLDDDQPDVLRTPPPEIRADPFYDMIGARIVMEVTEHVIVDGEPVTDGFKTTAFVRRSPGVAADHFFEYWLEVHAPNVATSLGATDGGLRYVVNHDTDADDDAPFHGVAEVWYRDGDAAKAHLSAVGDDGFNALCADAMFTMGHEQVLIG